MSEHIIDTQIALAIGRLQARCKDLERKLQVATKVLRVIGCKWRGFGKAAKLHL